jgi:hypothetical protein
VYAVRERRVVHVIRNLHVEDRWQVARLECHGPGELLSLRGSVLGSAKEVIGTTQEAGLLDLWPMLPETWIHYHGALGCLGEGYAALCTARHATVP